MTTIQSTITIQTGTINTPFTTRQIVVNNASNYGVYINLSSSIPTISSFDYFVPPNSNFASPELSLTTITWFCPAFLASVKNPVISLFDALSTPPIASPYDFYQFVNFPNFPHVFTPTSSPYDLPNISIQKYQNVFFTLKADVDMSAQDRAAFILYSLTPAGNLLDIGAFNPLGGVISYSPQAQPDNLDLRLFYTGANVALQYNFNAFQTEISQEEDYTSLASTMSITPNSQNHLYNFAVNPPGFIWHVRGVNIQSTPSPHTLRVLLTLIHTVGSSALLTSQDFSVSSSQNSRYLVRPRIQLVAAPAIAQFTIVNFGTAGSNDLINIALKNL